MIEIDVDNTNVNGSTVVSVFVVVTSLIGETGGSTGSKQYTTATSTVATSLIEEMAASMSQQFMTTSTDAAGSSQPDCSSGLIAALVIGWVIVVLHVVFDVIYVIRKRYSKKRAGAGKCFSENVHKF